jgi:hypothetical protein
MIIIVILILFIVLILSIVFTFLFASLLQPCAALEMLLGMWRVGVGRFL